MPKYIDVSIHGNSHLFIHSSVHGQSHPDERMSGSSTGASTPFPRSFITLHALGPFLGSQGHINRAASHIFTTYEVGGFLQLDSLGINCPP